MRIPWPNLRMTLLANSTTQEIFNYILTQYANITILMHHENKKEFEKPMDPTKPLVLYTKKQEKCQTFAMDAKEPIFSKIMVNTRLSHATRMDLMMNAYCERKQIPKQNKMDGGKHKLQELNEFMANGMCLGINAATMTPKIMDEIIKVLDNLVYAMV